MRGAFGGSGFFSAGKVGIFGKGFFLKKSSSESSLSSRIFFLPAGAAFLTYFGFYAYFLDLKISPSSSYSSNKFFFLGCAGLEGSTLAGTGAFGSTLGYTLIYATSGLRTGNGLSSFFGAGFSVFLGLVRVTLDSSSDSCSKSVFLGYCFLLASKTEAVFFFLKRASSLKVDFFISDSSSAFLFLISSCSACERGGGAEGSFLRFYLRANRGFTSSSSSSIMVVFFSPPMRLLTPMMSL